jgi:hypothetical protein
MQPMRLSRKQKGKTASASSKAAAAPADSSGQDPCAAFAAVTSQLLNTKTSSLINTPLFEEFELRFDLLQDYLHAQTHALDGDTAQKLVVASAVSTELLSKLLSLRKRPRDWKQQEYSIAVLHVLSAVTCFYTTRVQHGDSHTKPRLIHLPNALGRISRQDLLAQAAAAQEEVCQLLQAHLQQQQQQVAVQGPALHHQYMRRVAAYLLLVWLSLDELWCRGQSSGMLQPAKELLGMQKPALELAAVLTRSLTADSHPDPLGVISYVVNKYAPTISMCVFTVRRSRNVRPWQATVVPVRPSTTALPV